MKRKTHWSAIALFVVLATFMSGAFRSGFFDFYNQDTVPYLAALACVVFLVGWGPALAGVITQKIFGLNNAFPTLRGRYGHVSLFMAAVPAIVLAGFGVPNDYNLSPHINGAAIGALIYIYALGEEIGWRGFLHGALDAENQWVRILLTATIWWVWHLWFLGDLLLMRAVLTFGILLAASFALDHIVKSSRSIMCAAAFHAVGNIGIMGNAVNLPNTERLMAGGIALIMMIIIYHRGQNKAKPAQETYP